jgi:hypothetical protein
MRQPKIYIRLPSDAEYWPSESLSRSVNGEYPVFSMTARDELLLKTPDALMNGQAVVDVIQSCMPNITNAWDTPNIDLDVILIAIRLSTYGETMETTLDVGNHQEMTYQMDLRSLLDQLHTTISWQNRVEVNEQLVVYVKPLTYRDMTQTSVQTFEAQRIMSVVNDSALSDQQKIQTFRESFTKLTEITVGLVANAVYQIDSVAGATTDPEHIAEFMQNCDREVFESVRQHLDAMREQNSLKPMTVETTTEMRAQGSPDTMQIPLVFDPASFFA